MENELIKAAFNFSKLKDRLDFLIKTKDSFEYGLREIIETMILMAALNQNHLNKDLTFNVFDGNVAFLFSTSYEYGSYEEYVYDFGYFHEVISSLGLKIVTIHEELIKLEM